MDISGLDKAAVLAALYNASKAQGMGILHYEAEPMSVEQARQLIEASSPSTPQDDVKVLYAGRLSLYFDYLKGRVMKVDLSGDDLNTTLYNRDNGEGAA